MTEPEKRLELAGSKDFEVTHETTGIFFEGWVHYFPHLEGIAGEIAQRVVLEIGRLEDYEAQALMRSDRDRPAHCQKYPDYPFKENLAHAWADAIIHQYQKVIHSGEDYNPQSVWFEMNIWPSREARTECYEQSIAGLISDSV